MDSWGQNLKQTYAIIADEYTKATGVNWPLIKNQLNNLSQDAKILDLGCGNGKLVQDLLTTQKYLGVDFSSEMLEIAKNKYPKRKFILEDVVHFSPTQKYDAVFCLSTIHHLRSTADHLKLLQTIEKSLAKDGIAVLSFWQLWRLDKLWYHLTSLPQKLINLHHLVVPYHGKTKRLFYALTDYEFERLVTCTNLTIKQKENVRGNRVYILTPKPQK